MTQERQGSPAVYLENATQNPAFPPLFAHRPRGCLSFHDELNLSPLSGALSPLRERTGCHALELVVAQGPPGHPQLFAFGECAWYVRSNVSPPKVCISPFVSAAPLPGMMPLPERLVSHPLPSNSNMAFSEVLCSTLWFSLLRATAVVLLTEVKGVLCGLDRIL